MTAVHVVGNHSLLGEVCPKCASSLLQLMEAVFSAVSMPIGAKNECPSALKTCRKTGSSISRKIQTASFQDLIWTTKYTNAQELYCARQKP